MRVLTFLWRRQVGVPRGLPFALVLLVIFQGLLGMWTVTLLLKPLIVTLHLIFGLTTLSLLWWLWLEPATALFGPVGRQCFCGGWRAHLRAGSSGADRACAAPP